MKEKIHYHFIYMIYGTDAVIISPFLISNERNNNWGSRSTPWLTSLLSHNTLSFIKVNNGTHTWHSLNALIINSSNFIVNIGIRSLFILWFFTCNKRDAKLVAFMIACILSLFHLLLRLWSHGALYTCMEWGRRYIHSLLYSFTYAIICPLLWSGI